MLHSIDLFSDLTSGETEEILVGSRRIHSSSNQVLYTPDDRCDSLSLVLEGKLRISKFLPSGQEQIMNRLEKGQMFGEALVFAGRRYASYVVSEVDSEILKIPKKVLLYAFKNQCFLLTYLRSISEKILNLSSIIEILSLSTVKKKIASYLLELSLEKDSQTLKLPCTKKTLASLIGSTREVVSRNFSELERDGIISMPDRNTVEIRNLKRLENLLFD